MAIKIFSDLKTGMISFEGSRISDKDIGSIEAVEHPTESNRVIVRSTREFKRGSSTEYRVYFKRLKITRIHNKEDQKLTNAPFNYDRTQILAYLNEQFEKPVVNEYFEYDPTSDRLIAQKDIEVRKSGFFLGGKHKMASGASNIYYEDLDNKANSYPVFGEVLDQSLAANQLAGEGVTRPKSRIFQDFQSVPLGGSPVNDTAIGYDGDNFFPFNISGVGITTRVAEVVPATQQLKYEIIVNGISVYVQYLEHNGLSVNEDLTWYFDHPLDIENGTTLRATVYKVSTVDNQEQNDGILQVCEGDATPTRYQTNVLNRFFTDEDIALKSEVDALLSGSTYKGSYNGATASPTLPTGTDVLGDFYRVTAAGGGYATGDILVFNGTDYDHIAEANATASDIKNSGLKIHDIYVKAGYAGAVKDGSVLYPYDSIETAIGSANDGDSIYLEGNFEISGESTLPSDKSLFFYGSDDACISFTTFDATNGSLLRFTGTDNTKEFKFKNITFKNAGEYGLYITKAAKVEIDDCVFTNNGWNGTALNTILPSTTTALLGYDSSSADLQAFYAGSNASNGGAMRLEEITQVLITGNTVTKNLRGIRVQDCGVNGAGFITRNQSTENIESGIYLAAGTTHSGCQNITVSMNVSAFNANNGLLLIGGINNKFSQNEVKGNWNAGACFWGSANATLRDCGLYDNNRAQINGIGNTGDAKASIQINEAYDLLGTTITLNSDAHFIAEILDTQVHYTGLGSNSDKIGFLIASDVGSLADNGKNIIKVDDVGFIGQDHAIDLSEVDVSNLRLAFGDNSYQSIALGAVKAPLAGNYSELPFSNHVISVPSVDVVVDTLKQTLALHEGVGGNVINSYHINELVSNVVGSKIDILLKTSDKIQLRGLTFGNIYINGVVAGNDINSANDSLNAAFTMNLIDYKSFLVSEVGINGDESSGGSLPAIANNWYVSYGSNAGVQMVTPTIGNTWRNYNPFYNGEALEKGHEFIWTHNPTVGYLIGIWGAAEVAQSGSNALQPSNWTVGFAYNSTNTRFSQVDSSGVTIQQSGNFAGYYGIPNGQLAIRFGQDNHLYLYEIVNGGYQLIGKSNSTIAGTSVMIQWASFNEGSFPVMTERTETWEVVADEDGSLNGEWAGGLDASTVIRSRMSFSPGEKITLNMDYFGRSETIGFGYSGTATGQVNAQNLLSSPLKYTTTEILKSVEDDGVDWTWNTSAAKSYDPNGDGSDIGYGTQSVNIGLISFRYKLDNTLEMWHETDNVLMATKVVPFDGSAQKIFIGTNEFNHAASRIPALVKYDMSAEEEGASLTGWYYVESPDGEFYYPLFATEAEANHIDSVEGGSGTSHTHTYVDDVYNGGSNTWYMPDTSGVHAGTSAPQGGIFGNSINVVWNEIPTGDDANYLPTFNNITYNVQEGSAINIQYKAAGMTDTFNLTNVPAGYADNGFAIIGTAEDISNGYGQSVQHVINVTKANDFGSVQGTITINVLANLSGNEFTLVDQGGALKFTQDGGVTVLDFNTVTFNAGSTYKFYLDGSTLQTNDIVQMVDANGNGILGNDGLTQMGAGAGYAGAHFQYAIPSDVAPGKFIKFTDGATSTAYADVPLTIAGSTYSASVTGITLEGPVANQTGTNLFDAGDHGWLSIDEPLAAGERIIFSGAFLSDVADAMADNSIISFGVKDTNWANTINSVIPSGFEGGIRLSLYRVNSGNIQLYGYNGDTSTSTTILGGATVSSLLNYNAFLEVTSSGNNVRGGYALTSTNNANTVAYSDWDSTTKIQSGDQGYGISTVDVMVQSYTISGTDTTDANDIDWTTLSEIAIPVTQTNDTNWTKGIDFSGGNEHLKLVTTSTAANAIRMGGLSVTCAAPSTTGFTSNDGQARPWATAIVFKYDGNSSNQHIWNSGEGAGSTDDNIYLRIDSIGQVHFGWGRQGAVNECEVVYLGTSTNTNHWHGIYIAHNGTRLSGANATAENLAAAFDIRWMTTNDNPPFTNDYGNRSTAANWTAGSTGGRMDRTIEGDFTIGGRGSNRNFHGQVSSMVVTTLNRNVAMPTDAEIKMMITDPVGWLSDYKVGNTFRQPHTYFTYTFSLNNNGSGYATQVYLMGDGSNDSYANGIRNEVINYDQNYTKLQFNSMLSDDIQNVTISGLS